MTVTESAVERSRPSATRKRRVPTLVWPLLTLAVILLFNAVFTQGFFRIEMKDGRLFGSLIDIPDRAAPAMLVAIGMTLVLATGGVDLSVGAVMAISATMAAWLIKVQGWPFAAAVSVSLLTSVLAGAWNGLLVAWLELQPIVATLILMVAGRGIAQLLGGGQILTVDDVAFNYIGSGYFLWVPFTFTLVAIMLALTAWGTRRTAAGLFIESVGNNATASEYAGVNAKLVKLAAYTFCGLCSGLAGLVAASDIRAADANNVGLYLELDAILAVVIGGTSMNGGRFMLIGSIIGALIIQSMTTTILMTKIGGRSIPAEATLVVKSIVVLVVCLLQSDLLRQRLFKARSRQVAKG